MIPWNCVSFVWAEMRGRRPCIHPLSLLKTRNKTKENIFPPSDTLGQYEKLRHSPLRNAAISHRHAVGRPPPLRNFPVSPQFCENCKQTDSRSCVPCFGALRHRTLDLRSTLSIFPTRNKNFNEEKSILQLFLKISTGFLKFQWEMNKWNCVELKDTFGIFRMICFSAWYTAHRAIQTQVTIVGVQSKPTSVTNLNARASSLLDTGEHEKREPLKRAC